LIVEKPQQKILFNPADPAFLQDPYPFYDELRQSDPIHYSEMGFWFLTRYDDVKMLLTDKRFVKQFSAKFIAQFGPDVAKEPAIRLCEKQLLFANPPDHSRLRQLMKNAFNVKTAQSYKVKIATTEKMCPIILTMHLLS
jgi:cytochrome P450